MKVPSECVKKQPKLEPTTHCQPGPYTTSNSWDHENRDEQDRGSTRTEIQGGGDGMVPSWCGRLCSCNPRRRRGRGLRRPTTSPASASPMACPFLGSLPSLPTYWPWSVKSLCLGHPKTGTNSTFSHRISEQWCAKQWMLPDTFRIKGVRQRLMAVHTHIYV